MGVLLAVFRLNREAKVVRRSGRGRGATRAGRQTCRKISVHKATTTSVVQAKVAVPGGTAALVYGKLFSQVAPQQMLLKGLV